MRRFRLLFLGVALALLAPLAVLIQRALHSVALERQLYHQAVAERVFDEMERSLSRLLEHEETQPFERYGREGDSAAWPFVVGRFQIDPGGGIDVLTAREDAGGRHEVERRVDAYWRTGGRAPARSAATQLPGTTVDLDTAAPLAARARTGDDAAVQQEQKLEDDRAYDVLRSFNKAASERAGRQQQGAALSAPSAPRYAASGDRGASEREETVGSEPEHSPMRGRVIDAQRFMLYRTVLRDRQTYRQGALIDVAALTAWLQEQGLGSDGVRDYADVAFATPFGGTPAVGAGAAYVYQHRFGEPFDDLSARLALRALPGVGRAAYVYALAALVIATAALGMAALYRMASVTMAYAERRSNFVAAVSHELKTPLTAIRMYGEMLRDGLVASEAKRDEYHRHITVESERLSRLINNVLEFARLEKGTRDVTLAAGSLAPAVREIAQLMRPHVEAEGFELCLEIDDTLPDVRFERDAFMQVLWNLVDNAVKYGRDGWPRRIALRCWHDDAGVHVAVRDHGPGVPARQLGRIFEPFYRGENELTRRNKGTGLGLALVRGLVERMRATVRGSNAADGGFEAVITFRVAA